MHVTIATLPSKQLHDFTGQPRQIFCHCHVYVDSSITKWSQFHKSIPEVANVNCTWVQELKQEVNFGAKDARRTFAAIPTIIVVNIAFNLCFNSMSNAFPSQACQMDLRIGSMQLNGAFFHVADAMAVVIFTPIFEFCLYPVIARVKGSPVRFG